MKDEKRVDESIMDLLEDDRFVSKEGELIIKLPEKD
jgi:hypothetical protein